MSNPSYHEIRKNYKLVNYYFTEGFWIELYDSPEALYSAMWTEHSTQELPMTIKIGYKNYPKSFEKTHASKN